MNENHGEFELRIAIALFIIVDLNSGSVVPELAFCFLCLITLCGICGERSMVSKPGTLSGLTDEEKEQWLELISSNPYSHKKSKSSKVICFRFFLVFFSV